MDSMKQFIVENAGELELHDRYVVMKMVQKSSVKICSSGDGVRVNLDKLEDEDLLRAMFHWVKVCKSKAVGFGWKD